MWNSDNQETAEDRENMTYVKIYVALKINEYKVIENGCSFIYTTYEIDCQAMFCWHRIDSNKNT